jgi:prepilin-type N-terminal cleavage/methylation domain-containing protein
MDNTPAHLDRGFRFLRRLAPPCARRFRGFTLIELLVVIAIIGILSSLLLPAIAGARERAKAIKVHAELYGLGLALEMYSDDYENRLPPVRVNCNTDLADHWCQFPVELAEQGYLPKGDRPGMAANMEDVFNPGHTYKYAAPGPKLLNGDPDGNYTVWVPDDFPNCESKTGAKYSSQDKSPMRWIIWSMGPRPDSAKNALAHLPVDAASWYRRTGDGGVLIRSATHEGMEFKSP